VTRYISVWRQIAISPAADHDHLGLLLSESPPPEGRKVQQKMHAPVHPDMASYVERLELLSRLLFEV